MQIGHVIAQLRIEKGISQKKLAEELHVSPGLVGMWETNKRLPSIDCLISLIDYFKISADVLLDGERKIKPSEYSSLKPAIDSDEKKLLDTFYQLDIDGKDILIGEAKKLLRGQRSEEKRRINTLQNAQ